MILNIITFFSCLLMLLLFRKLDKSNPKITKLRRYSSKIFNDYQKMTEEENRKIADATIEMDILIKKAASLTKDLKFSLGDTEERLELLNSEKTNLDKIKKEVKIISLAAKDVNDQIKFIASAKKEFQNITEKISFLLENLGKVKNESSDIIKSFNDQIREIYRKNSEEFSSNVSQFKEYIKREENNLINESEGKIRSLASSFQESLASLEQKMSDTGDALLDNFNFKVSSLEKIVEEAKGLNNRVGGLKESINNIEHKFFTTIKEKTVQLNENIETSFDKLDDTVDKTYERIIEVENSVNESKNQLMLSVEVEVDKIKTELDSLNLQGIAKKDEIVQAVRKEAESIGEKIDNFEDKYIQIENRIIEASEKKMNYLNEEYKNIEARFNNISKKFNSNEEYFVNLLSSQTDKVKQEFSSFEDKIFNLKKELLDYEKINEDLKDYQQALDSSQGEVVQIKNFLSKVDDELYKYENTILKNLAAVSKSEGITNSLEDKLVKFQKIIDRSDKKIVKMNDHLKEVEEDTIILKARGKEIEEVKDKLNEIDSISLLIEKRIDQLYTMFQKIESLKKDLDHTDSKLKGMFNETDQKMKEFANFIQKVDSNNLIAKKISAESLKP